jgi:hypothetical protein
VGVSVAPPEKRPRTKDDGRGRLGHDAKHIQNAGLNPIAPGAAGRKTPISHQQSAAASSDLGRNLPTGRGQSGLPSIIPLLTWQNSDYAFLEPRHNTSVEDHALKLELPSFSLNPDLLRATGVCLHVDLSASVRRDDLEVGGKTI